MELIPEMIQHLHTIEKKEEILDCCKQLAKELGRSLTEAEIYAITFGFEYGQRHVNKKLNDFFLDYVSKLEKDE